MVPHSQQFIGSLESLWNMELWNQAWYIWFRGPLFGDSNLCCGFKSSTISTERMNMSIIWFLVDLAVRIKILKKTLLQLLHISLCDAVPNFSCHNYLGHNSTNPFQAWNWSFQFDIYPNLRVNWISFIQFVFWFSQFVVRVRQVQWINTNKRIKIQKSSVN